MSEEGNFPEIVECVACGKDLIRERYMGMYPDEDTGNVEKSRQRRSRPFAVLTYCMYVPRVKRAAALLDNSPPPRGHAF